MLACENKLTPKTEQLQIKWHKGNTVIQNKHASAKERKGENEVKQVQVKEKFLDKRCGARRENEEDVRGVG